MTWLATPEGEALVLVAMFGFALLAMDWLEARNRKGERP